LSHSVAYDVGFAAGSATETFDLPGRYTRLTATLGLVKPSLDGIVVEFRVEADGIQVIDQNVDATRTQAVDVTFSAPAAQITLISDYGVQQLGGCDAVWGDVRLSNPATGS
jgi:NPCBM/NEW2 domain